MHGNFIFPQQMPKFFTPPIPGEVIPCNGINYTIGESFDGGAFGDIYLCNDDWQNNLVAKIITPKNNQNYEAVRNDWYHELDNLMKMRHPNITYIHNFFEYRDTFYLIIERCAAPLTSLINNPNTDGEIWLPFVARDILHGLDYIHRSGYAHKDLHSKNVLFSQQFDFMVPGKEPICSFKIADLGISRFESDIRIFNTILARWMVPPEYLDHRFGPLGRKIDIYHVGLLLLSLLLKKEPVFTEQEILSGEPKKLLKISILLTVS